MAAFAPKAVGAHWLHHAVATLSVRSLLHFSSMAAAFGNVGQANYAAANAYLDAAALCRRAHGQRVSSMQLPTVRGAGMGQATIATASSHVAGQHSTWSIGMDQYALALHAMYAVMQQVLTDAVFADSVATGVRAGPYTTLFMLRQGAGLVSPLLQLGYFALAPNANHWTEAALRPVMLAGIGAGTVSCLLMASLDQSRTLGQASEAAHVASPPPPAAPRRSRSCCWTRGWMPT